MRTIVALLILNFSFASFASTVAVNSVDDLNSPAELARRCAPETANDPKLFSGDFRWGYTLDELIAKFREVYASGKRLPRRMYWDAAAGTLALPTNENWGGRVRAPEIFVESVRRHVESALRLKYVDGIFFPDMGHSHFYVPSAKWKAITGRPPERTSEIYEAFFNEPELKVLYHTAEQLRTLDAEGRPLPERPTLWRFFTRNILGDNRAQGNLEIISTPPGSMESKANTVGEIPGYARWGAGFNISASNRGCYAFRRGEEILYFDLSLFDLEPETTDLTAEP